MALEIKAPVFPESVVEGTLATWHKQAGDRVSADEALADIETDKIVLEVVAPEDGVLDKQLKQQGDTITSGEPIALFSARAEDAEASNSDTPEGVASAAPKADEPTKSTEAKAPQADEPSSIEAVPTAQEPSSASQSAGPAARKALKEHGLTQQEIAPSGKGGRVTKADVSAHLAQQGSASVQDGEYERHEKRVPMTRLRASIAKRLVQAQHEAAMLTTFNEVNMQPIVDLRNTYKETFEKVHRGVRLGFMGFFVRAVCEALKRFPSVNASLDEGDIVYHGYQDIGVAVASDRGLIVPVIRHVEHMSIARIEAAIRDFGARAKDNKIQIEELQGGTFTITNGGVFGSLMSTPILNPPQTGILGMHAIKERPVVEKGQIVIRPMMYLALSYDHRVIDGREAVQFLVNIKDMIEDPARIILEL